MVFLIFLLTTLPLYLKISVNCRKSPIFSSTFCGENYKFCYHWEALKDLEKQGIIKIYTPEDVRDIVKNHKKKKYRILADSVYQNMIKNAEILIEGQIPAEYARKTN